MSFGFDSTGTPFLSAYYANVAYKMYKEDECVKIDAIYDNGTITSFATYEVAVLFPVSKDGVSGHLDMLVVLDKDKHIVACLDNADWIFAFIQSESDSGYSEIYEKMFFDIIRQIHLGVIHYVGK